jgi:hypothetical protein
MTKEVINKANANLNPFGDMMPRIIKIHGIITVLVLLLSLSFISTINAQTSSVLEEGDKTFVGSNSDFKINYSLWWWSNSEIASKMLEEALEEAEEKREREKLTSLIEGLLVISSISYIGLLIIINIKKTIYEPTLIVSRKLSRTKIEEGEELQVDLSIRNISKKTAKSVSFSEEIPVGFLAISGDKSWNGDLNKKESKSFKYALKAVKRGKYIFEPIIVKYKDEKSFSKAYESKSHSNSIIA